MNDNLEIENKFKEIDEILQGLIKEHREDDDDMFELIEESMIFNIEDMAKFEKVYEDKLKDIKDPNDLWEIFQEIDENTNKENETMTLKLYRKLNEDLWRKYLEEE